MSNSGGESFSKNNVRHFWGKKACNAEFSQESDSISCICETEDFLGRTLWSNICGFAVMSFELGRGRRRSGVTHLTGPPFLSADLCRKHER